MIHESRLLALYLLGASSLSLAACGASQTRSDEPDHWAAAEQEESLAHLHRGTDPLTYSGDSPAVDMSRPDDHARDVYVPEGRHLARAELHRELAREHEAVAAELTDFHAPVCGGMEAQTLVVCPLLGPVVGVEDVDDGVLLRLAANVDRDALLERIRCHIQFAGEGHGSSIHRCPLYLHSLSVEPAPSTDGLILKVDDPVLIEQLREEVRAHVLPASGGAGDATP